MGWIATATLLLKRTSPRSPLVVVVGQSMRSGGSLIGLGSRALTSQLEMYKSHDPVNVSSYVSGRITTSVSETSSTTLCTKQPTCDRDNRCVGDECSRRTMFMYEGRSVGDIERRHT